MSGRTQRLTRIATLSVLPPAVCALVAFWAFWPGGGEEPVGITENGVLIERSGKSRAIGIAEERTGLRPLVPESIPLDSARLISFDLRFPDVTGYAEPAVATWFGERNVFMPELIYLLVSTEYPMNPPSRTHERARQIDIGVDSVSAWQFDSTATLREFVLQSGDLYAYVFMGTETDLPLGDVMPMLRSIAEQLE